MCYKFCLEFLNGTVSNLILARVVSTQLPQGLHVTDIWTMLQSLNLIFQCIGSILVAPLIRRFDTPKVLSFSILGFAGTVAFIPLLEGLSGGRIPPPTATDLVVNGTTTVIAMQEQYWGSWSPFFLFIVFPVAGIFHGMVELIRRVIPAAIVGGDPEKLKKMDATVHIWYEVSGTLGAFVAAYSLSRFGYAFSAMWIPLSFLLSYYLWRNIDVSNNKGGEGEEGNSGPYNVEGTGMGTMMDEDSGSTTATETTTLSPKETARENPLSKEEEDFGSIKGRRGVVEEVIFFVKAFFYSVKVGAVLVFTNTSLIWLIPSYVLPLVIHRYFENTFFPFYGKYNLGDGAVQSILVGGSNFGELCGAATVLVTAASIRTPMPFIRLDALALFLIFFWCYFQVPDQVTKYDSKSQFTILTFTANNPIGAHGWAWRMAPLASLVSFGWASGDVSLSAYVQERLAPLENKNKSVSLLGSVMSFLYVSYLLSFFILNISVSKIIGPMLNLTATYGKAAAPYDVVLQNVQHVWFLIGGLFFSISSVIIFASTFIPQGSWTLLPGMPQDQIKFADSLLDQEGVTEEDREAIQMVAS